jgi:hypothetical protein
MSYLDLIIRKQSQRDSNQSGFASYFQFANMKYLLWSAVLISIAFISFNRSQAEPTTITFGGEKWNFPSTVEDAVNAHDLMYKPPGYYYKIYPSGMTVILRYHYKGADFVPLGLFICGYI